MIFSIGLSGIRVVIAEAALPNTSEKNVVQLEVGDSQAILRTIFLTGGKTGKFPAIAH